MLIEKKLILLRKNIKNINENDKKNKKGKLVYKNIKTGEVKEFSSTSETFKNFDWTDKNWVYQTMAQKVIVETKSDLL